MAPSFWDQSSSEQNEALPSLSKCLPHVLCHCCAAITPLSQGEELSEERYGTSLVLSDPEEPLSHLLGFSVGTSGFQASFESRPGDTKKEEKGKIQWNLKF